VTEPVADPDPGGGPKVSVVLICFNDRDRLPEAIESARAQTLAEIEIIVVDHGSTDGSIDVARAAADGDPRIRVIDLGDNLGKPGRPINAGIRAASAPWVTVFASDDVLRPRACEHMLRAATEFSADIVVGSLQRVNMDTGENTRWMAGVTSRTRVITHVGQLPELIRDTTGGGKLYNVDFIRRHHLAFPEDIYYQDQVFTLEYYASAATVVILSNFVLEWRHWPTGRQSVTQRRTTVENLSDRFTANERIDAFLAAEGREDLLVLKQRKFLQHDLSIHVKDLSDTTPEYRRMLVDRTNLYVSEFPLESFVGLPLNKYLMVNCVRADRLDDAEAVTTVPFNRITATWPRLESQGRTYLVPPWRPHEADSVFDVTDYRLGSVPFRFGASRVEALTSVERSSIRFTVTVSAPDRAGRGQPRKADLVLADTSQGNRLTVGLKQAKGRWQGSVSVPDLDAAFGGQPGDVDLMSLFDDGTEGRWSAQVHQSPDQAATGSLSPWTVVATETGTLLRREHGEPVRRRLDVLNRRPPTHSDPALGELLSLSQARAYLKECDLEPQPDHVFFESFAGRRIADGPLVLSRRLEQRRRRHKHRQSWSCTSWAQLDVPAFATPVPRFSVKYLNALAESSVWFDNGWLPFRPGPSRRLVQLWHGTPFSRLPIEADRRPPWHCVASSGPYFEGCLTDAWPTKPFRFVASGAPRTDPLLDPAAARRRTRLRESWGLDGRTVVLFAPALRAGDVDVSYRQPDLQYLATALGPDYFWLHRDHDDEVTARRMAGIPDDLRWFAAPISGRVEISDYLLMADVLITDYSSVLTDFALTGRPIVRYITDGAYFEDVNPGTYLSAAQCPAGLVVSEDNALVAQLKSLSPAQADDAAVVAQLAPLDAQLSADALLDWLEL